MLRSGRAELGRERQRRESSAAPGRAEAGEAGGAKEYAGVLDFSRRKRAERLGVFGEDAQGMTVVP